MRNSGFLKIKVKNNDYVGFIIFFSFVLSMNLWIGWENRAAVINVFLAAFLVCMSICKRVKLRFTKRNFIAFTLLILTQLYLVHNLKLICLSVIFFYICFIEDKLKVEVLDKVTKCFAILLVPSLIVFFLLKFVQLPSLGIIYNGNSFGSDYGVCENYIFYVQSYFSNYKDRFNGPFLEPGHLGMMSAFLLLVNKFNMKEKPYLWIIVVANLCSLSLAGYVLICFAVVIVLYYKGVLNLIHFVLLAMVSIAIYMFIVNFNNGDNLVNTLIFSRLEYDESRGFVGNNRVFGLIPQYYEAMFDNPWILFNGYDPAIISNLAKSGSRGTGYIMWMVRYGIIGTVLASLFYVYYFWKSKVKKFSLLLFLFVVAMFWQRCCPFWTSWIICYMYGIVAEERDKIMEYN